MKGIEMRTFESVGELASTALDLLRGPTFLMMLLRVNGKFREQVILTVSITNNCGV